MIRYIILSLIIAGPVLASLSLIQPLQSQLPLVARVNASYSWSFQSPFSSSKAITYSCSDLPSWISFDNVSLTLSGTPTEDDIGSPSLTFSASDGSSTAKDYLTLSITDDPQPVSNYTLAAQFVAGNQALGSVYTLSPYSALQTDIPVIRIPPHWSFSIGVDFRTFVSPAGKNIFYASSSLPEWAKFDPEQITFSGVTPPNSTNTNLNITVYGSDEQGYQAVSQQFLIVVNAHELSLRSPITPRNVTAGNDVNTTIGLENFEIDGQPLNSTPQATIDTSAYPWLASSGLSLSGTAPNSSTNITLPLTISVPAINQTLNTTVTLDILPSLFTQSILPALSVQPGASVDISLGDYLTSNNVNVTIVDAPWLSFNAQTLTLSGTAPSSVNSSVTILVHALSSHVVSEAVLPLSLESSSSSNANTTIKVKKKSSAVTVAAVVGAIGSAIFVLCILMFCRSKCAARTDDGGTYVVGEDGNGYWREKGALDYGGEKYLDEPDFEEVYLGGQNLETGSQERLTSPPMEAIYSNERKLSKAEFFSKLKNSFGRGGGKKRPVISRPVHMSLPPSGRSGSSAGSYDSNDAPSAVYEQESLYASSSASSHSSGSDIPRETPVQRPDFAPVVRRPPPVMQTRSDPVRAHARTPSVESNSSFTGEVVRARSMSIGMSEGTPRLVEFKKERRPTKDLSESKIYTGERKVSQKGVISSGREVKPRMADVGDRTLHDASFRDEMHYVSSSSNVPRGPADSSPTPSAIFFDGPPTMPPKASLSNSSKISAGTGSFRSGDLSQSSSSENSAGEASVLIGSRQRIPTPLSILEQKGIHTHKDRHRQSSRPTTTTTIRTVKTTARKPSPTYSTSSQLADATSMPVSATFRIRRNEFFTILAPFPLPPSTEIQAALADGRELPDWLKFDPKGPNGEFWGILIPDAKVDSRKEKDWIVVVECQGVEVGRLRIFVDA
ncbi:hypothetical protein SISSUDRAFT_1119616 [Sistotremastrum suecicum HHB10207 ss-3]|uniref:Dystroglycan-type cadherin-like domain-containing protein n=1 Tax=Sistotremastrum suecicum HHB10207 ss-3 TaxID=1314776 RepID=A0A166DE61_9AGAM|nr:hypothetical protein SISSUDRAFT_1119616 [Sistotremastrum suecicum HHB10207 ss-3]